jgi:hypothetical protein
MDRRYLALPELCAMTVTVWVGSSPRLEATASALAPQIKLEGCRTTDTARIPYSRSICIWYG